MFTFLIVGLLAGWLAGIFFKGEGYGIWGNLLVGVIGSYVGGWIFGILRLQAYGMIGEIITATVGAIAFIWVWKKIANK